MGTDQFAVCQYSEGRTNDGQMVSFCCPSGMIEAVKKFLADNIRGINIPTTNQMDVAHGAYGKYTRYKIKQHKYAGGGPGEGGGGGYIEVLEIYNPPENRWGIVMYEYTTWKGGKFSEWETLEHACSAFEKCWGNENNTGIFSMLPGFKRYIPCGALTPWFYAIGDEALIGDYAFPEGLQDDPVYRFGQECVVYEEDNMPVIKICMGTRFIKRKRDYHPYDEYTYRMVYWNDGTYWNEHAGCSNNPPRPLEKHEQWIMDALEKFRKLLAGKSTNLKIPFINGTAFLGKLTTNYAHAHCPEGNYYAIVRLKGEEKPAQGWIYEWKPTPNTPDIVTYIKKRYEEKGKEVESITITKSKTKTGGKKWHGVFHKSPY